MLMKTTMKIKMMIRTRDTMEKKVSYFHKREDGVRGKQKQDEAFKMVQKLMGGV